MAFDNTYWKEMDEYWEESGGEEAKDSGDSFDILPKGEYDFHISDFKFMMSLVKGTPGLNMEFTVISEKGRNRKVWHTFWLTPKNMPYVARDIRIITGNRVGKPSDLRDIDFTGVRFPARIKHEEYEKDGEKVTKPVIDRFLARPVKAAAASSPVPNDDDIPF